MSAQRNPREPIALTDHHLVHGENVRLRHQLAGSERARAILVSDLDAAYAELRRERLARRRLEGLTRPVPTRRAQALALLGGIAIAWPAIAWLAVAGRMRALWTSLTDAEAKHDTWMLPIATGICAAIFLLVVLAGGR